MPSLPKSRVAAPAGLNRQDRRRPKQVRRGFVGIPEAATYLDVTTKTVRRMIARGQLEAYRLGDRLIKIRIADLDALMTPVGGAEYLATSSSIRAALRSAGRSVNGD